MSRTRPWVDAFAAEMEKKLAENRRKGDREGWSVMTPEWLFDQLEREVEELRQALRIRCGPVDSISSGKDVRGECADVANFAMMIADVAGGMRPRRRGAR